MSTIASTQQSKRRASWLWLFPFTYLVHIAEEYWVGERFFNWLSMVADANMTAESFLQLNGIFFLVMTAVTWLAIKRRNHLLALVLATIVLINTLLHFVGSVLTWSYSPGVLSAIFLWLPLALAVFYYVRMQLSTRQKVGAVMIGIAAHAVISMLALVIM